MPLTPVTAESLLRSVSWATSTTSSVGPTGLALRDAVPKARMPIAIALTSWKNAVAVSMIDLNYQYGLNEYPTALVHLYRKQLWYLRNGMELDVIRRLKLVLAVSNLSFAAAISLWRSSPYRL